MNCISCGKPIKTVRFPYCNTACMFHNKMYKDIETDPNKITEISNVYLKFQDEEKKK